MEDDRDKLKQFSYKANANLVLAQDRGSRRGRAGDTGEAKALKVDELSGRMGDKAFKPGEKSTEVLERRKRVQQRSTTDEELRTEGREKTSQIPRGNFEERNVLDTKTMLANESNILDVADELDLGAAEGGYVPTTRVSQAAFEALLAFVTTKLGDQPPDLLRSAASETLAILKDQRLQEKERKKQIEEMLSVKMNDDEYSRLSMLGRKIKDFGDEFDENAMEIAEEDPEPESQAVAIQFKDRDLEQERVLAGEEGEELNEVIDIEEEDTPLRDEKYANDGQMDLNSRAEDTIDGFDPLDVDAYWIQRQLSKYYDDAQDSQDKGKEVFAILALSDDDPTCENKLVALLGFDKLDFISLMILNRSPIVYCTRLARASSPDERAAIEMEMRDSKIGLKLLNALSKAKTSNIRGKMSENEDPYEALKSSKRKKRARTVHFEGDVMDTEKQKTTKPRRYTLRKLDLDDLGFDRGGRLMSIRDVKLPKGSEHSQHKDYEEWHIPANKTPMDTDGKEPIPISELPDWCHPAFSGTQRLNKMQSKVYPCAFGSDENMLLCAPTGAGKTNVAVLSILRAIQNSSQVGEEMKHISDADLSAFKAVYVAPMKALVSEVVENLGNRLGKLGISVRELTGDISLSTQEIENTQVIVTTPEKWDIITRKSGQRAFTNLVRLLIVDEIHLLHDDRGPVLEAIIARTCRSVESLTASTRIVGLSATLPNYKDVAVFMRVNFDSGLFFFDASHRPCPLQQSFLGITGKKALKRFQLMNELTYTKVKEQINAGQQVIVFVHSRKETYATCQYFIEKAIEEEIIDKFMKPGSESHKFIEAELPSVNARHLSEVFEHGFGMHHAGMSRADRQLVEKSFEDGHIRVLVSTATLAWGVNLPAHAVIIKGTQVYSPEHGRWVQLSSMDVMQMMGRAGRPQFDTRGEGIIITTKSDVLFYLSLLNDQLPIESQVITRLVDMLNAEVAMGTVSSVEEGAAWLTFTYLYVRMLKNPILYGIPVDEHAIDPELERRRVELIHTAADILQRTGLVHYNAQSGSISGSDLGRVAADFYVSHQTISHYVDRMQFSSTDIDLLRTFSLSGEFRHIRVREEEKLELSRLAERIPIPVKESLEEPTAKVNVLLQSFISNLSLDGLALRADMVYVTQSAARLCRAMFYVAVQMKLAVLVEKCLKLSKAIDARQWTSQTPLRQFYNDLGDDLLYKIERKDISFERYYDLTVAELTELLRSQALGRKVHRLVHSLPRLEIEAQVRPISRAIIELELTMSPDFRFDRKIHGGGEYFWIMVEDSDSELVLHSERFFLRGSLAKEDHILNIRVQLASPLPPHYFVRCMSDKWIVPSTVVPVSLRGLLLPEKFSAHTKLLDLRPLSITNAVQENAKAIEDDGILDIDAYREGIQETRSYFEEMASHFSPMQTQLFPTLFEADTNAIIATLPGKDRTVCAELALARLFCRQPTALAVWVVSRGKVAVGGVKNYLQNGIGQALKLNVGTFLTGQNEEVRFLRTPGTVVVTTVEKWDMFSRKWRQKREGKILRRIGLVIFDGVHHIADRDEGAALEIVASRMRQIASGESGKDAFRIVALSDPIANAKEVGQWLSCPPSAVFSFHPSDVEKNLNLEVIPFTQRRIGTHASQAISMVRPVFSAIQKRLSTQTRSFMIFTPTRKVARSLALEIVGLIAQYSKEDQFLNNKQDDLEKEFSLLKSETLKECMTFGVAYLTDDVTLNDRKIVEKLFMDGSISIIIAVSDYAWQQPVSRPCLVIVAGTAREDDGSITIRRSEYSRSDLLRMLCLSHPPAPGKGASAVIVTNTVLFQYYKDYGIDPFPIESRLFEYLSDHMNAEIASGSIQTKQDAVDYLTWTFFYRRLPKNPNYYGVRGYSHEEISGHLSEMVDRSLSELEASKCVAAEGEEEVELGPLNLGIIAAHYYIRHATVELFASSLSPKTKLRGLIDILSLASEFEDLPVRLGEEDVLLSFSQDLPIPVDESVNSHTKAHLLLQAYMKRKKLPVELNQDLEVLLPIAVRLIRAMVDVVSSAGWLKPALCAIDLSQTLIQGAWESDSPLMQLPYIDEEKASILQSKYDVSDIFGFLDMEQQDRAAVLKGLSKRQVLDVAAACQAFPNMEDIDIESIEESHDSDGQSQMRVVVNIERSADDDSDEDSNSSGGTIPKVSSWRYPEPRDEGWWVIVGDSRTNSLLTLKHVSVRQSATVKLDFASPPEPGKHKLQLYLMSDSYIDCDQEETFEVTVTEYENSDEQEENDQPMSDA